MMSLIQWAANNLPPLPTKPIKAFRHLKKVAKKQKRETYHSMFLKLSDEELRLSSQYGKSAPLNKQQLLNLMREMTNEPDSGI